MKTYNVTCPDPDCAEEFKIEMDEADLAEGATEGELIECPACEEEWEWIHDADNDILCLLPDEDQDDDMPLVSDDEYDEAEDELP